MCIPMVRRVAVAILATKIVASLVACGDGGPLGTISGRTINLLLLPDGI